MLKIFLNSLVLIALCQSLSLAGDKHLRDDESTEGESPAKRVCLRAEQQTQETNPQTTAPPLCTDFPIRDPNLPLDAVTHIVSYLKEKDRMGLYLSCVFSTIRLRLIQSGI